ncbi:MAG TPA: adenylate/guanylate cyclase domain-containing protein [Dongiaceae bacterium]|nr:adenylate/guanylate cyclase domain-containing protein [Dongiaceae bacterium]
MPITADESSQDIPGYRLFDIIEWLSSHESRDLDEAGLITGLGERLQALPLQVDCIALYLRALHPEIRARLIVWSREKAAESHDRTHAMQHIVAFPGSPFRAAMETGRWQRVRADTDERIIDQLEIFRGRGMTELLAAPLPVDHGPASAIVFATRGAGGYTAGARQALERIQPALSNACELRLLRRAEASILDTYIGPMTGRRILAGHIRRGEVESLEAALLLCDLRDFTGSSNRLAPAQILELLNRYFDEVVPAITDHGGEVVKFIGDAVLAFFHCDEGPVASCTAALRAANSIQARLADARSDLGRLRAGVALHHGEMSYGNIGAGRRLDFTVIGRDVNLLSRIQGVCGATDQALLMSDRFAALLGQEDRQSAGRFVLKGFAQPVELFTAAQGKTPISPPIPMA